MLKLPRNEAGRRDVLDAVYDRIVDALNRDGGDEELVLNSATRGERMVYILLSTDYEIGNGGVYQLFWNSPGRYVDEAVDSARSIGADEYANLLQNAAKAMFPGGVPEATGVRRRKLGCPGFCEQSYLNKHEHVNELDSEWKARSFDPQLRGYVRAHPGEFFSAG